MIANILTAEDRLQLGAILAEELDRLSVFAEANFVGAPDWARARWAMVYLLSQRISSYGDVEITFDKELDLEKISLDLQAADSISSSARSLLRHGKYRDTTVTNEASQVHRCIWEIKDSEGAIIPWIDDGVGLYVDNHEGTWRVDVVPATGHKYSGKYTSILTLNNVEEDAYSWTISEYED